MRNGIYKNLKAPVKVTCLCVISLIVFTYSCKKPYNVVVTTNYAGILVVEGIINTGAGGITNIKLSRTVVVSSKTTISPETGATITIENAQVTVSTLTETAGGIYLSPALNLDNTKQYHLRIKTKNGKTYLSDLVDAKVTPPIDSIGYTLQTAGMQIYANTHDPNNNTHYYRYTFRETWQFNARYPADYISNGDSLVQRTKAQQVYYCYGTDTSAHTIINSTAALSQDIAYQVPIISISDTLEKLETKYSILVTQQALTATAYEFYNNLKKNTEDLGSIFDAQPSQLIGNIHNINDASEPVIGYVSAGTIQQKRIYILKADLPQNYQPIYPYSCEIDSAFRFPSHDKNKPPKAFQKLYYVEISLVPLPPIGLGIMPFANGLDGFTFSTTPCTDCTIRGSTQEPPFWK